MTIDGPGASKPCKTTFSYGYQRTQYKGCINQETPGQYLVLVPDFGDNSPAPSSADSSVSANSITFSAPGTVSPLAPRSSSREASSLFWCATETDSEGFVSEWGKCAAGCLADPAGSYLPAAPRSRPRSGRVTVGELQQLIQQDRARPPLQFGPN